MSTAEDDSHPSEHSPVENGPVASSPVRPWKQLTDDLWHHKGRPQASAPGTASTKAIVDGLDKRELRIAYGAIVIDLYIAIEFWRYLRDTKTAAMHADASIFLVASLVAVVLVVLGTVVRRRALLGFALFFVAFDFFTYREYPFFLVNALFGGWLLVRASRTNRAAASASGRSPRAPRTTRAVGPAGPRGSPGRPKPSKRYTPPKPTRPKIQKQ